jgi:hypothetical protein
MMKEMALQPSRSVSSGLSLLLSVMLLLAAISNAASVAQGYDSLNLVARTDFSAGSLNSSAIDGHNNSSLALFGQNNVSGAPVDLSMTNGYYATHPISLGLGGGSRTVLANKDSATSMSHELSSAQGISAMEEYSATSSGTQDQFGRTGSASTHMQIDESVASGKVSIGVLVGGGRAGEGGRRGMDSLTSAWKDPAIEIEEEYVGDYHISKSFTLNHSFSTERAWDSWLYCCGGDYVLRPPEPVVLSADEVFNPVR